MRENLSSRKASGMRKTVVLIGKFLGELNHLKDALEKVHRNSRYLSFLDHDPALHTLLARTDVLFPDIVLIDENFPATSLPLLYSLRSNSSQNPLLIFFTRDGGSSPGGQFKVLKKSHNKKDYREFFVGLASTPSNVS